MKNPRRFNDTHKAPPAGSVRPLAKDHPALVEGRPLFPGRVVRPADVPRLLVSGQNNSKVGGRVTVGPWAGMAIFTLTLPERSTCPRSCEVWGACFGNGMPMAMRIQPDADFLPRLAAEVGTLQQKRPRGFVVRLHALGDFYSVAYVDFWHHMLAKHPALHIFGYTARPWGQGIGMAVDALNSVFADQCVIRHSTAKQLPAAVPRALTLAAWQGDNHQDGALVCPASTGRLSSCGACGACWHPNYRTTPIAFPLHGTRGPKGRGSPHVTGPHRRATVLQMIADAIATGTLAPTNLAIAVRLGLQRSSGEPALGRASAIVREIEAAGKISVQRFQAGRIITVVATGQQTAPPANRRPHHMIPAKFNDGKAGASEHS